MTKFFVGYNIGGEAIRDSTIELAYDKYFTKYMNRNEEFRWSFQSMNIFHRLRLAVLLGEIDPMNLTLYGNDGAPHRIDAMGDITPPMEVIGTPRLDLILGEIERLKALVELEDQDA